MKIFKKTKIPNICFIFSSLILISYLIIRFIDQLKIINFFPLDMANDISSYMALFHFYIEYGYHQLIPYWYNGFYLFLSYPPGFFFFIFPLFFLTKDIQLTTYISLLLIYLSIFLIIFLLSNYLKFSKIKAIFFFSIIFINPIAIGNFVRLGRLPELFGWLWFIILFCLIIYYKDKDINIYFLILVPLFYSILLISHPTIALLGGILFISLFLIKAIKEKIFILISLLISFLMSSFWLVPFLKNLSSTSTLGDNFTKRLLDFFGQWAFTSFLSILVCMVSLSLFYLYWCSKYKLKKELLFFLPINILAFLLLTRIIIFIPLYKNIFPHSYLLFLTIFGAYWFLNLKFKRTIYALLVIVSISFVVVSIIHTPFFVKYTQTEYDIIDVLNKITERFIMLGDFPKTSYFRAYYSYAPIYLNLSTSDGWSDTEISRNYLDYLDLLIKSFKNNDCIKLLNVLEILNTSQVISYGKNCNTLEVCKFRKLYQKGEVCLYER